ncbi:MAG: hypothetical protein II262_07945 [Alistipes sp.]|nr:hypothetical protein [Alistipes sp.]
MKRVFWIAPLVALFALSCGGGGEKMPWEDELGGGDSGTTPDGKTEVSVGQILPAWSEGELDIHFINTGRGECAFYILPDGTTLLVDAGELKKTHNPNDSSSDAPVAQKPNASVRPYMVNAQYIKHFMPKGKSAIDYCAPSHFHIDHIGDPNAATETAAAGYRKTGLMALYDQVPYLNILDRSYPDYKEDATTPAMEGGTAADWAKFVTWGVKEGKFTGARFTPGKEQIVLVNDPDKYKGFKILNICANGYVWSKTGLAGEKSGVGNPASCGFHLSYGLFDYIACGDLTSNPQNRVGYYVRDFIGESHLDAFKCHHHLSANAWGSQMKAAYFNPRVIVNMNFYMQQPDAPLVREIMENKNKFWVKDFFTTNLHPQYHTANKDAVDKMTGSEGHIVIRVANGGGEFMVYMLDDNDLIFKVKSIHGPYKSR